MYILDHQFQSLQDLVTFYGEHDVPNVEAITGVRLTCPVEYSPAEIHQLQNDLLRQHRSHPVSTDDAQAAEDADELSRADRHSNVDRVHRHSLPENQRDSVLLSKRKSWCKKIFEAVKQSNRTSRMDAQSTVIQLVTSQPSHEVVCNNQLVGSFSENPKKFEKQPAIPDESTHPALCSVHENSAESASALDDDACTASLYYSEPRNVDRDLSADLMAHLLQQDNQGHSTDGKCICGLDLADSELPRGWSMHISTENGTEGRVFFTSPAGETSWELPTIVSVDLSIEQQDRIRQLMNEGQRSASGVSSQQMSVNGQFVNSDKRISI